MNIKFFSSNENSLVLGLLGPACFLLATTAGLVFLGTQLTKMGFPLVIVFLITTAGFIGGVFLIHYYMTHSNSPFIYTYQREVKRVYGVELSQTALQASRAPTIQPEEEEKQYHKFSNDNGTVYAFKWVNGNLILTDENYQELERVN